MLSFYHSQPIYTVYPRGHSHRRSSYSSYPSSTSTLPLADREMRYRHALTEYLAAEEEYKALLRAREEARLRARVEEALRRQKRARLLQAEIVRARAVELALDKALSRAAASKDNRSLRGIAPFIRQTSERHSPYPHVIATRADETGVEKKSPELLRNSSAVQASVGDKVCGMPNSFVHCPDSYDQVQHQNDVKAETSDSQPNSEGVEHSVPNLESLVRERLQKIVGDGDEEVQDVARAILRHLAPVSGISRSTVSAPSTRVRYHSVSSLDALSLTTYLQENTYSMQPPDGADLYRSDALQGVAAEAAKESFKSHRAEVAERDKSHPSSPSSKANPSPLRVIQDIRSALTKLSSGFTFPTSLDFSDDEPDGLAYTPTNAPVRVYEHALDNLLAQLDSVETDGDEEVRVVRRAAVKEVEKAIEEVERRISEAREGAKPGSDVGAAAPAEDDLAEDKDEKAIHADVSVDDDNKREVEEDCVSISEDSLDLAPSSPEVSSLQNSEVVLPQDATRANSEPKPDESVLHQSSSPVLESLPEPAAVATPTAPSDQGVASPISTSDPQELKYEASADQVTTDQTTSASLEPSSSATPLESPATVILGAIAPSTTPVSHILPSPVSAEDVLAAFDHDWLSLSQGTENEDDSISIDADDEREWIEVEP